MDITQKLTYIKSAGSFANVTDALNDILSILPYNVSDSDMKSVVRELENSTTLIETRTWTPENYSNYRSTRQAGQTSRTNSVATLLSDGWTVKEEIDGEISFNNT
jgi:hypothetical protein